MKGAKCEGKLHVTYVFIAYAAPRECIESRPSFYRVPIGRTTRLVRMRL